MWLEDGRGLRLCSWEWVLEQAGVKQVLGGSCSSSIQVLARLKLSEFWAGSGSLDPGSLVVEHS